MRASKTVNGGTTVYQYVGDKLYYEQRPDGSKLYFFYDSYGNLTHLYHHVGGAMTAYNVVTNSQGDVIALYNWNGNQLVASYEYDAWGNCAITQDTTGIGAINPIRYRGYYYDSEIGMYYLQSRYYDPNTGRFINADGYITTGQGVLSYNMYAYCMNNPVMMVDYSGEWPDWLDEMIDDAEEWVEEKIDQAEDWIEEKIDQADAWIDEKAEQVDVWIDDKVTKFEDFAQKTRSVIVFGMMLNDKYETYSFLRDAFTSPESVKDIAGAISVSLSVLGIVVGTENIYLGAIIEITAVLFGCISDIEVQ